MPDFGSGSLLNSSAQKAANSPAASLASSTYVKNRMRALVGQFPGLTDQYDVLLQLAMQQNDDATMMENAVGAVGMSEISRMSEEMKSWDPIRQRGEWSTMTPSKQNALLNAGFVLPEEKKHEGLLDKIGGAAGHVAGFAGKVMGAVTGVPLIKQTLGALDYIGEETSRVPRNMAYLNDSAKARQELIKRGIDPDQFAEQTGIYLPGDEQVRHGTVMGFAPEMLLSRDFYKAWNHNGHEGDDDFLPTRQIEVYDAMYDKDYENASKDFLLARELASGKDVADIAADEGFDPLSDEYTQRITSIYEKMADEDFQKATSKLAGAHISPGRQLAREMGVEDGHLNDWSSPGRWISGATDMTFQILFDPTMAAGKVSQSAKAARWGVRAGESVEDIERFRASAKVFVKSKANEDITEDLAKFASKGNLARRGPTIATDVVMEGKAVHGPAQRIVDAFDKTNLDYTLPKLQRDLPQIGSAMHELKVFDAQLAARRGEGIKDIDDVFDFYNMMAGGRAVAGGEGKSIGAATSLFGTRPDFQYIPHTTARARAGMKTKGWFRTALIDGRQDSKLAQHITDSVLEVADEGDETEDVIGGVMDDLMNWMPEKKNKIRQFTGAFTTHVAGRSLALEGQQGIEDFSRLVEYGSFASMPRVTMDKYMDMYIKGNMAQRAAVGNTFIADLLEHSGLASDEAGRAFRDKFIGHARQAYGIGDKLSMGRIGEVDTRTLLTRDAILSSQLADSMAIPSFRDFIQASRKQNKLRSVAAWNHRGLIESGMGKVWKPAQMMRIGFIFRNAGEEVIQFMGRNTSLDYLRSKLATDWMAGMKGAAINRSDALANSAFMRPITSVTHGMRSMLGVSDEALEEIAIGRAVGNADFALSNQALKDQMVSQARNDIIRERRMVPRSVVAMDEWANHLSASMSFGFHEIAQQARIPSKVQIGEWLAGGEKDRLLAAHKMIMSGEGSAHWGDMIGKNTFRQATGYNRDPSRYMLMHDPSNPSGLKAIKMRIDNSNYSWVGHDQIESYYWNMNSAIDSAASSVQGQTGFRMLSGYVNPTSVADFGKVTGITGKESSAAISSLRADIMSLADGPKDQLRLFLKNGRLQDITDPDLLAKVTPYKDLEQRSLADLLSPDGVGYATDDLDFVRQTMVNRVYASLRRADNEDIVRKTIRMNADTSNVIADGTSRIYLPMVDRRSAEGMAAVFSSEQGATAFAENLATEMKAKGLSKLMPHVWDGASPGFSGYTIEDWMNTVRTQLAFDGEQWIPSALIASRNADVATAVRDAMSVTLDQLGAPQTLKPTLGYMDFASDSMDPKFGLHAAGEDLFHVEPGTAVKAKALDPTTMQTHFKVQTKWGEHMWVPESDMDSLLGPIQGSNVTELMDPKLDNFATFDRGKLRINTDAIYDDWEKGAGYLRGEGRVVTKTTRDWEYPSLYHSERVDNMLSTLEFKGRAFPDLREVTSKYRAMPKAKRAEIFAEEAPEWVLKDPLWGPLSQLEEPELKRMMDEATSKKGSSRKVSYTVQNSESRAVPKILEEQGIDVEKLINKIGTRDRYREFLVEREKARLGLANRQVRAGTELTPEAIRQEHAAVLESLRRLGVDPKEVAINGREVENVAYRFAEPDEKGYKVLDSVVGSGETEDTAIRKAADDSVSEMMRIMVGKNGDVMHEILHHANAGDFTMRDLWDKGKIQDMPDKMYGPQFVTPSDGKWERIVRGYFDGWANPAISALSRTPMYRFNVSKAQDQLKWVYDNVADKELRLAAEDVMTRFGATAKDFEPFTQMHMNSFEEMEGDPWSVLKDRKASVADKRTALGSAFGAEEDHAVDMAVKNLTDDQVETLMKWTRNENLAWNTWRDASLEHGRKMTIPFIDDHNVRSQFQEYIGSLIPFWYSEEQFLKRTVRGLIQTPELIRKGQLTMHAMRSMGVVRKDDNGNEVFVYPGSAEGLQAIAGVAEMVTGGKLAIPEAMPLTSQTKYMIPGFNSEQAGNMNFGPMVGLPMEFLSRRFPEWEDAQQSAFGDVSQGSRPWYDYVVPGSVTKAYRAWLGDADRGEMASAQMQAIQMLAAADKGLPEGASPLEKEEYLENVRGMARTIGTVRALTYFTAFNTASPMDTNVYGKDLKDMLADGVEWADAVRILTEKHGARALPYTVFASQSGADTDAPLPYTADAANFLDEHDDYLKAYPSAAAWLLPVEKKGDKFSRRAYDEMLSLELRRRRSPEEMMDAVYNAQAAPDFFDQQKVMKGKIANSVLNGDKNLEKALKAEWANWRDTYYMQHPVFAENRTSGVGQARREKTLEEMRRIMDDPLAPPSESLESIRGMVQEYDKLQAAISALSLIKGNKGRVLKSKAIESFRVTQWMNSTPTSERFFSSVIEPDLESDDVTLAREAKEQTVTQRTA